MTDVVHYQGEERPRQSELHKRSFHPLCGLATVVAGERVTSRKVDVTCRRCKFAMFTPRRTSKSTKSRPLPKTNPKRIAKRRKECFGPQASLCKRLRCAVCVRPRSPLQCERVNFRDGPVPEAHHEPPRSCGGVDKDTVPLCFVHHAERHSIGIKSFENRYGIDLRGLAAALHARIEESNGHRKSSST